MESAECLVKDLSAVGEGTFFGGERFKQGEEGAAVGGVQALMDFAGEQELLGRLRVAG